MGCSMSSSLYQHRERRKVLGYLNHVIRYTRLVNTKDNGIHLHHLNELRRYLRQYPI